MQLQLEKTVNWTNFFQRLWNQESEHQVQARILSMQRKIKAEKGEAICKGDRHLNVFLTETEEEREEKALLI